MKPLYLLLLFGYCLTTTVKAQIITDITANAGTSNVVPFGIVGYAANENIYTETEVGGAANFTTAATAINAIAFSTNTVGTTTTFNNVNIYLKNISAATTTFTNGTYSTAGYTLVYSGSVVLTATGFTEINLATAFTRTSGTNLQMMITRTDNTNHNSYVWDCAMGNNLNALANSSRRYSGNTALSAATALTASRFRPTVRLIHRYNNDAKTAIIYTLGKLPKPNGLPHVVSALVTNVGKSIITNLNVTLNITGANTFSNTKIVATLAPLASAMVTFNGFNPVNIGINTVTVSVPADDNAANNSLFTSQLVNTNTWSYANGAVASGGVGFNGASGDFVAKFNTISSSDIYEVSANFFVGGQTYRIGIWDATGVGGTPGVNLWTSANLVSIAGVNTIPVAPVVNVAAGNFYVGVKQIGTTNVSFSYQDESPIRSNTFYYTSPTGSSAWTDFAPANSFLLMIEPKVIATILPIKTEYFIATKSGSSHLLNWKVNCSNAADVTLAVEAGNDGVNFKTIHISTETALRCLQSFSYLNSNILPGINYYRLKSTDNIGQITYSDIVSLDNVSNTVNIISIAPNPVTSGICKIQIAAPKKINIATHIVDINGRVVATQNTVLNRGANVVEINIANIAKGVYEVFGITTDGRTRAVQLLKQ
jgi:Secretion system C-terminal sorting domain